MICGKFQSRSARCYVGPETPENRTGGRVEVREKARTSLRRRSRGRVLAASACLVVALAACGGNSNNPPAASGPKHTSAPPSTTHSAPPAGPVSKTICENRRRFLLHIDALGLHRGRQRGHGAGDPVLHQHLREIQVRPDAKRHRQRRCRPTCWSIAWPHVAHAIRLLLDRQGNGVDDVAGAGARIAGGDLDGRRDHIRILGDRQTEQCNAADQDEQNGQHIGQHRPFDEEPGDHRAGPAGATFFPARHAAGRQRPRDRSV